MNEQECIDFNWILTGSKNEVPFDLHNHMIGRVLKTPRWRSSNAERWTETWNEIAIAAHEVLQERTA